MRTFWLLTAFVVVLALMATAYAQVEPGQPGDPAIDVDRNGWALAWTVFDREGRSVCKTPYVDFRRRRIECSGGGRP